MGLGILDDTKLQHVPGKKWEQTNAGITKLKLIAGTATVLDDEVRLQEEHTVHDSNLKYDPTGQIILVPQPSNDPNDPLVRILRGYPNIRIDLD